MGEWRTADTEHSEIMLLIIPPQETRTGLYTVDKRIKSLTQMFKSNANNGFWVIKM